MSATTKTVPAQHFGSMHGIGVACGLGAGVWLGAAEAPTKLVNAGLSPYSISLCMVAGVFTARWTLPMLLKGTRYVIADLMENKHLIVWAILAGMLWAVANTLTVFAIRDVGLTIAFPLWNTNSLVGILWGRVLFGELKGASKANVAKVVLGALAIVAAAVLLGFSTIHGDAGHSRHAVDGVLAATGASLLWGTMYIPYRKAYISGMNPLSFVTAFTVGELGSVFALVLVFDGGTKAVIFHSPQTIHLLFWLFLGGFVWVIGDLFQQFAAKYLGIGRGIPLSNTNQIWGLAWGALVFGELAGADTTRKLMVVIGSEVMILGALAISSAVATARENSSTNDALIRGCNRYRLDYQRVLRAYGGSEFRSGATGAVGGLPHHRGGRRSVCLSRAQRAGAGAEPGCALGLCTGRGDDRDRGVLRLGALEGVKVFLAQPTWRLNQPNEEDAMNTTNQTEQPLADMEEWDEFLVGRYKEGKSQAEFRQYDATATPGVAEFYRQNHEGQTVAYVLKKEKQYFGRDKGMKTIWEAAEFLNTLVDDSDPDTDLTQIEHLLQTSEAIRRDGHPRWMVLTSFIHDLGKCLCLYGEPQWGVVGDTFPVGCAWSHDIVFPEYFANNPDKDVPEYQTKYGIYEPNCGLENVHMSFGHDGYIAKVMEPYLRDESLYMLRFHSFYPWHRHGAYDHLCNDKDRSMLGL